MDTLKQQLRIAMELLELVRDGLDKIPRAVPKPPTLFISGPKPEGKKKAHNRGGHHPRWTKDEDRTLLDNYKKGTDLTLNLKRENYACKMHLPRIFKLYPDGVVPN